MINNSGEHYWWLKKCLVCNEYHEGGNLPCTNYKWDTQYIGIEEFNRLYMGTFPVDADLVKMPDDIKSLKDFIKWVKGAKDMGGDQGLNYLG